MHKHENLRKKLYDTESMDYPVGGGLSSGVVTIGAFESGGMFARADNRCGRGMPCLRSRWKGVSLFFTFVAEGRNA